MTDTIQTVKEDIAILQEKLKKLEELDRVKTPCEEAYKRLYGCYPMGEPFWIVFKKGYDASQKDYKVEEELKAPTLLHILCEWCDDDIDLPCGELVNMIEQWLPDEIYIEYGGAYERGWNDALRTIKEKLR